MYTCTAVEGVLYYVCIQQHCPGFILYVCTCVVHVCEASCTGSLIINYYIFLLVMHIRRYMYINEASNLNIYAYSLFCLVASRLGNDCHTSTKKSSRSIETKVIKKHLRATMLVVVQTTPGPCHEQALRASDRRPSHLVENQAGAS